MKQSHTFQDVLSRSPEEFSAILNHVKTEIRLAAIKGEAPCSAQDVILDKGTDYNSISSSTRRFVSDEFYNRHKDNLAAVLGQDNLDTIRRLENKNMFLDYVTLKERFGKTDGVSSFTYETCFGSGGTVSFINELCKGTKLKAGDRLCITSNFLEDPEFDKLEKRDVYLYEGGGKYKHCSQAYIPLRDDITADKIVDVTKAVQAKNDRGMKQASRGS